jgi:pimeloyl-ACP methyl ester carboxylesterase
MSRSRNRIFLKVLAFIVALSLLAVGWLVYSTEANLANPTADALAALSDDEVVGVDSSDWLVLQPVTVTPTAGLILYPGANCDIRGYAPVLRKIAAAGYLVVAMAMPFDLAIFAPNRADDVRAEFPQIREWVVAGHSLGGVVASRYAFQHQDDLAGLILWDSYPAETNSLADSSLPVMHIHRAMPDGRPASKFIDKRHLFPVDAQWVPVPGGMHMYFGSFDGGGYTEEWEPGISRDAQHELVVAAMLQAFAQMSSQ